jgi:Uma2 family endonuclease
MRERRCRRSFGLLQCGYRSVEQEGEAMSQAPPSRQAAQRTSIRLSAVDWDTYTQLLRAFAERPGIRLTYDRGELEIMSPLLEHDWDDRLLGRLVVALTEELGLPIQCGGSVTMRRRRRRRGLEADETYWIANASRMAGRRRLNLRTDPPPDLAIEVDVTNSSLDRMSIYASLRVPEVWRLDGDTLTFHALDQQGQYQPVTNSLSFPQVTPADLLVFLQQGRTTGDQNAIVREFRVWVRQRHGLP